MVIWLSCNRKVKQLNRRDRIFDLLDRSKVVQEYTPAAFFLHFGADAGLGSAAIERHTEYFHATGMDFVKIQYERNFAPRPIEKVSDWNRVDPPGLEFYEPQLAVVKGLVERLKSEAPVIVTLYSPFMCLGDVGTKATLGRHLLENPDALTDAFQGATESLLTFVLACIKIGVDGFYHSTQGGESRRFPNSDIFDRYIKPWDLALMREIDRRCSFNILHICDYHKEDCGGYDDLTPFLEYPGSVVNCSLDIGGRTATPQQISSQFGRPFMGGLDRKGPLSKGSAEDASNEAERVLASASERFILGADCTVPSDTPWANLKAAIDATHARVST